MTQLLSTIDRGRFQEVYLASVKDVLGFWSPQMQTEVARHNTGWQVGKIDFSNYLRASELRYWIAFDRVRRLRSFKSWCDVGGFFGAYPLALQRLGVDVAMTEALSYYSDAFSPLFDYLRNQGVEIIDHDPFEQEPLSGRKFDVVSAMAVLEHYPNSPRHFMESMRAIAGSKGIIYVEVPNIAYWPRRWALLFGKSPLPSFEDVYHSKVPFLGHHHEYTMEELRYLATKSGCQVVDEVQFNYSFVGSWLQRFKADPLLTLMSFHRTMRECLALIMISSADRVNQQEAHV